MNEIYEASMQAQDEAVEFLRELIRVPSPSGDEARVVEAVRRRMDALGFEETRVDPFGNVLGRVGNGRRQLVFDAHLDTVGIGDPRLWEVDPFGGELHDGIVYGRGASDQKAGMAALVYAGALIRRFGIEGDASVWIVGSVLEEDCDGLCWDYILSEGVLAPELVVLTEPTELDIYRGQRGRMEIELTTRGLSCHGSAPERGVNAIFKMAPVLAEIERLHGRLPSDPFLGAGSVTVSEIRSTAPSLCAVADSCTIHLDRRLTLGETDETALAEIESIAPEAEIIVPEFRRGSHTGHLRPLRQYFPPWCMPEDHRFVQMALRARSAVLGDPGVCGKWTFSTNGVGTMGLHGVPTIGFGPASEKHAHAPTDQCPVGDIGRAIAFYVAFTSLFMQEA